MGILDLKTKKDNAPGNVLDTSNYKNIEHLTSGPKSQNEYLKMHYNSMYQQNPDRALDVLGTWDDFSSKIINPDEAGAYFDYLFDEGFVSRTDYPEYYKKLYTPFTSTHDQKVGTLDDDKALESVEFDTTIKYNYNGEPIDVGVAFVKDGTLTKIDEKSIATEYAKVLSLPSTIPSLLYILDPRYPFDMSNPGISNYNRVISGGGVYQEGQDDLFHPEAFKDGEYIGAAIGDDNLELKILNRIKQSGEIDFVKLFKEGDEELIKKFGELYEQAHYEITLESDSRLKGKAIDIDLEGLRTELDNYLEAFITTLPMNEQDGWREFKNNHLLNMEISDIPYMYTSYDEETLKKFTVNGYYDPAINNFLNTNHALHNILLPMDMDGNYIIDDIDTELLMEYSNAINYIVANPELHPLLPNHLRHDGLKLLMPGLWVDSETNAAGIDVPKHLDKRYFFDVKQEHPYSWRFIDPNDPSKGSWPYQGDIEGEGPYEGIIYKPTREQAYLWKLLGNPKLVETLEQIFSKYESDENSENYKNNVKNVMVLESKKASEEYLETLKDYATRDSMMSEGYTLINTDGNEIIDEPDSVSRLVERYHEVNNWLIHLDVLSGFQNAYNEMGSLETFINTIVGSSKKTLAGASAHMSDALFEQVADALNVSMDTAFPAEAIRDYVKILREEYPHYDRYISENQSTFAWLMEGGEVVGDVGSDLLALISTTKMVAKLGGGWLLPNLGKNLSLGSRAAIVSGSAFSLHTLTDMTFDPNNTVGFYRKEDSKGISDYAFHDSPMEYAREVSIPAISSFLVGAVFPKLGNAHGGLSASGYKSLETLGKGEIQAHLKSIAGFLLESGYLTGAGMVDGFVQTGWAVYNQQFEEGYKGESITLLGALDKSLEMLFFGGDYEGGVDPTMLLENFMMMTFLHASGNWKKFDFRQNKEYKQKLYDQKLIEGNLVEGKGGVLEVKIENWEVRNNYLQYKQNKIFMDMADEIIKTRPVPEYVKKGAKNADDIRRINQWWKKEYREPDILFDKIKTLLAEFHGKKVWIPKIEVDPNGKETTTWKQYDYGSPEMQRVLTMYEKAYTAYFKANRPDPFRIDEKQLDKMYWEVWEMYSRNEFAFGALNGLDFKTSGDRTLSFMNIKLQNGDILQVDPFTNSMRVITKGSLEHQMDTMFPGVGEKVKAGN